MSVKFTDIVSCRFSKNFHNKFTYHLQSITKENEKDYIIKILSHFKDTLIVQVNDERIIKISVIDKDTSDIFDYMMQYVEVDGILKRYLYNFPPYQSHGFLLQEMTLCSCVFKNYEFIDELDIIDGIKKIIKELIKYAKLNLYYLDLHP
jgi:hypothetical protein